MKKKAAAEAGEELTFEQALGRLEALVEKLEAGELTLAQSLEAFEEGMKLARRCNDQLTAAEKRVMLLQEAAGGEARLEPWDGDPDADDEV